MERFLGVVAGPFQLALPLSSVRQILDVGAGEVVLDPRALGVMPHSLAELLGETPTSTRPAVLLFDSILGGMNDPLVLTCCALRGVIDAAAPKPLPQTVACQWPGLLRGTLDDGSGGLILVLDARVLMGLVEAQEQR